MFPTPTHTQSFMNRGSPEPASLAPWLGGYLCRQRPRVAARAVTFAALHGPQAVVMGTSGSRATRGGGAYEGFLPLWYIRSLGQLCCVLQGHAG